MDTLYSTLQSKRDSLVEAAELGSSSHSVVSNAKTASDLSKEAVYRSNIVNGGVPALLAQVNRLEQRMHSINQSAERAAMLTSQSLENGKPVQIDNGFKPEHFTNDKLVR